MVKALIAFGLVMGYKVVKWAVEEILSRRREKIWWETMKKLEKDPSAIVWIEE